MLEDIFPIGPSLSVQYFILKGTTCCTCLRLSMLNFWNFSQNLSQEFKLRPTPIDAFSQILHMISLSSVNSGNIKILLGDGVCFPERFESFHVAVTYILLSSRVLKVFVTPCSN